MRYIGSYPLIEDNSVRSDPQTVFDAQVGYADRAEHASCGSTCSTCSTRKTNDITYYYTSRLPGEPAQGVADTHVHPGEKRSFRISLAYNF